MAQTITGHSALVHRGRLLEWMTVLWNCAEGIIGVTAGLVAGSIALVGFGIDSAIEVASGAIILWRLLAEDDAARRERAERSALRLVGVSFLALAAYVLFEAALALWRHESPAASWVGLVLAAISLVVMPWLARAKRRVAAELNSAAMHADSRQTALCAYLSAILLGGLGLNAAFGWWWADPVAGLVMVPLIVYEGIEAVRGKTCCDAGCA